MIRIDAELKNAIVINFVEYEAEKSQAVYGEIAETFNSRISVGEDWYFGPLDFRHGNLFIEDKRAYIIQGEYRELNVSILDPEFIKAAVIPFVNGKSNG